MPTTSITAYIALGSNLGDRRATIAQALSLLNQTPNITVCRISELIESEPVGGPVGQGMFLNAAAELRCECSAQQLLAAMQQIEKRLGRQRIEKWGPRTIDLDLLLFGDEIIDTDDLKTPHPHMHERQFVIEPLAQIAPEVRHPLLNQTIRQMQQGLDNPPPPTAILD